MGQGTRFDKESKIDSIVDMAVGKGMSHYEILQYCVNVLGISETYAYRLIGLAKVKIDELVKSMGRKHFNGAITFLEQQRSKALKDKNDRLALDIQKEINKICNLYGDKSALTIQSDKPIKISWGGMESVDDSNLSDNNESSDDFDLEDI